MAQHHKYSRTSKSRLAKCEPVIQHYAQEVLLVAPFDLSVGKYTFRTKAQQKLFIKTGKSKTMNSAHLPNLNGLSEAVDLNIYIPGINVWEMASVYDLYEDLHAAAQEICRRDGLNILSGTCWTNLNNIVDYNDLLFKYRTRKYTANKKPFFDGPHFEMIERNR